jgi:signal transduction histidine kinase/ActR/RegA family two-component response regulator
MPLVIDPVDEYRVLLLPATRRDAEVTAALLRREKLPHVNCEDCRCVAREIDGGVGTLLMTDAALADPGMSQILEALSRQPPWSDIPAIVLCGHDQLPKLAALAMRALRNVTVLERPTSSRTLVSAVKAAIRARARQYQMREQFTNLQESESALRLREQQLHTLAQVLEDANRRKDEFLAMLAHELRNPLAPIRNASEILARKLAHDPQMKKTVSLVKRQVTHLARLVDDLLDVSRITEGRIELRRAPQELAPILAQARESVEPLMREKQHVLSVSTTFEPLYVYGDHARLVQSVANVLTNAAKYTDPGGEIRLELRRQQGRAAIVISDSGVGISPELLPRVFDLFVQGDRSLDRSQGGMGIGLSVVKRLIEMHQGSVTAFSAGPGRGSVFEIQVPLIDAPVKSQSHAPPPIIQAKRILIVDDNVDAANSLAEMLQIDGHATEVAYTGRDALASSCAQRPDVVLLDIGLPDMNGYEVAAQIRTQLDSVQLIALTGYGQSEDIRRASQAGFDAHLIKPVDFDELQRIIIEFGRAKLRETTAV